jgi:hypothetical protein
MIDISTFYAYSNYLRSCFKFPRAENRALYKEMFLTKFEYMHLVNILRIFTFSFLVGHSILTIRDFNSFRFFWDTLYRNYLIVLKPLLNACDYTPGNLMILYLYLSILERFRFVQIF